MKEGLPPPARATVGRAPATALATVIVCLMLPLASAGGVAIISVVVVFSVLFLWWLLRVEAREGGAEEKTEDQVGRDT